MRGVSALLAAVGTLAACAEAAVVERATSTTAVKISTSAQSATSTSTSSSGTKSGCAAVSAAQAAGGLSIQASDALACLQSVPLDAKRSSDYVDTMEPYIEFQSTLAYLKDPPIGWTLPGVDVLGGLVEIKQKIANGTYKSQWDFEVDLYVLVNILPHDFHFNLPMPLLSTFSFQTIQGSLVSVSHDGLTLPHIYFKNDITYSEFTSIYKYAEAWTMSPLTAINGLDIEDYLQYMTQTTQQYQDPDAMYNTAFSSLAFDYYPYATWGSGNAFNRGGHLYGFPGATSNYTFLNGTTRVFPNIATTSLNFTNIQTGQDLFNAVDLPPNEVATATATSTATLAARAAAASKTVSVLDGYPSPIVMHPDGYTSGYFIPNTTTAVLAMQAFVDLFESDGDAGLYQQAVIEAFLNKSRAAGMTKLIIDLQNNGGGDIFNGFDAFKQLFPSMEPLGVSRLRANPLASYLGAVFSATGVYNKTYNNLYQYQSSLDVNNRAFADWNAEDPPVTIYGDNFTSLLRYNFSNTITGTGGIDVTGYLTNSKPAAQLFKSEDMVLLYDGSCGSTCTIFAELMKSQGGVRSIALGGRPQTGPMQGVAGSKGGQVYTFSFLANIIGKLGPALEILKSKGISPPTPPASIPDVVSTWPLGNTTAQALNSRFNLRNGYHTANITDTPLQFVYEASNCRLFYTAADQYKILGLWQRVAEVAWGTGKCVNGSTVNADNSFPARAYDTVPFGKRAYSSVNQPYSPGLIPQKSSTDVVNATSTSSTISSTTSTTVGGTAISASGAIANTASSSFAAVAGVLLFAIVAL